MSARTGLVTNLHSRRQKGHDLQAEAAALYDFLDLFTADPDGFAGFDIHKLQIYLVKLGLSIVHLVHYGLHRALEHIICTYFLRHAFGCFLRREILLISAFIADFIAIVAGGNKAYQAAIQ